MLTLSWLLLLLLLLLLFGKLHHHDRRVAVGWILSRLRRASSCDRRLRRAKLAHVHPVRHLRCLGVTSHRVHVYCLSVRGLVDLRLV